MVYKNFKKFLKETKTIGIIQFILNILMKKVKKIILFSKKPYFNNYLNNINFIF